MIYIVSYIIRPNRDITGLLNEIQKPPAGWAHHLDDTWFIATHENASQLYNRLRLHLKNSDSVFIGQITPNALTQGWMPQEFWDWFTKYRNY